MSAVIHASVQMELTPDASARLRADMSPQTAVQELLAAGQAQDALKLLLCQCARDQPLSQEDRIGASLAEQWVREPSESNRRAAFEFAHAGGYRALGAWIAAAAGWSGGSLAPASQETPVPPAEHLTARATVAAINLMAALDATQFEARRTSYIERAMSLLQAGGSEP
ncbi:MAG: hypothetical protein ABT19_04900 [Rhodanobacter sp. SCN 68-63]|nr:MAG: hypothetical protein ABT19_04900 [Rhodanobacter sp. SCN 68-63]